MSELREAIDEMRNMRESYDQLAGAAEAYNEGKPALAQAITDKGVTTQPTDSLATMADKVMQISQDSYTIDGGEMYAKQLFGSLETPNYWNLYEVMASLLSDGRFVNYGGILLAEYYKGYDSIALSGAGAGGGYVTSDGQYYTEDTTHYWNDDLDGKGNRWVAYLFATEGHGFQITNTNTSPRSIHIGRHVGVIESLVNGRISEIVVTDGNKLDDFKTGTFTQNWGNRICIRGLQDVAAQVVYIRTNEDAKKVESIFISAEKKTVGGYTYVFDEPVGDGTGQAHSVIFEFKNQGENKLEGLMNVSVSWSVRNVYVNYFLIKGATWVGQWLLKGAKSLGSVILQDTEKITTSNYEGLFAACELNKIYLPVLEEANKNGNLIYSSAPCKYLYIGYKTNDKTKSVALKNYTDYSGFTDIELKDGYCKNLDISGLTSYLTKANVQAHIFDRLGVNDTSTGSVTLTLASAVYNLFTAEEIAAVTARTNITIAYA